MINNVSYLQNIKYKQIYNLHYIIAKRVQVSHSNADKYVNNIYKLIQIIRYYILCLINKTKMKLILSFQKILHVKL